MPGMVNSIRGALAHAHYQPVTPLLPVDTTAGATGRFQFGMPWPWEPIDAADSGLVDATGDKQTTQLLSQVWAPRTDGLGASFVTWHEDGPIDIEQTYSTMPAQFGRLYRAQVVGVRRLLLGGSRAAVVAMQTATERIDRLSAEWYTKVLYGEFRLPLAWADAYAPHVDTMLGTWAWG